MFSCHCGKSFKREGWFKKHQIVYRLRLRDEKDESTSYIDPFNDAFAFDSEDSMNDSINNLIQNSESVNELPVSTWQTDLFDMSSKHKSDFKIMLLNINSIINKLCIFNELIMKGNLDIIIFQETKIGDFISHDLFKFNGYNTLRRDRSSNGGGIIVLIKDVYKLEYFYQDDSFETIIFSIFFQKHKVNFIISYNPRQENPGYLEHLDDMLHKLNLSYSTLLIGDLNHDMFNKTKHHKLTDLMSNFNFNNFIHKATRIRDNTKTLIDVLFCNNNELIKFTDSIFIPPEISDHCIIFGALNFKANLKVNNTIKSRCINNEKLDLINILIKNCNFQTVKDCNDVDNMFNTFKKLVHDIINKIAPIKNVRTRANNNEWVDDELRKYFKAKCNKMSESWNKYVQLRNKCKSMHRKKFTSYFKNKMNEKLNSTDFWKFHKKIIRTKKSTNKNIYTILDKNNEIISDEKQTANIFNKFFTSISNELPKIKTEEESIDFINKFFRDNKRNLNINSVDNYEFKEINEDLVCKLLLNIKNDSSAGITEIPSNVLKHCASNLSPILCFIFNYCIKNSKIPAEWKFAIVTPLLKKGNNTLCDNYRGISVISPIAKIFEKIINKQILHHFDFNNLFSKNQHGFRANFSCETALQNLLDKWKIDIDTKRVVLALFIDFKKAFDLINPKLLFLKLFHYGFSNSALNLIKNYFENRKQTVKIHSTLSDEEDNDYGCPQGSVLGPLLFIIYINDLCIAFVTYEKLSSELFADDTTAYVSKITLEEAISEFKKGFEEIEEWVNYNQMIINWSKTKFMILTNKKSLLPNTINLSSNEIEVVDNFKLLGIHIDKKLSFDIYFNNLKQKVNSKVFALKNLFFLSENVRIQFFKSFLLPHFDYCASISVYFPKSLFIKIKKLYNTCLYHLFKLDLRRLSSLDQNILLKKMSLEGYKARLFCRLSLFSYKIMNNNIFLCHFKNNLIGFTDSTKSQRLREQNQMKQQDLYIVPHTDTIKAKLRLSFFLPSFLNTIFKSDINMSFSLFKNDLDNHFNSYFKNFLLFFF